MAVLADGRVLTWGQDVPAPGQTAFPTYVVSIPAGSNDTSVVKKLIVNDDVFCAGETFLPDGRLFVSGGGDDPAPSNGTGRATTDIFDPLTSSWSSGPTMNNRRWYPSATLLPSGDILNLLGSIDDSFDTNETPDVTTNHATGIRSLTGVASATLYYNYPRAIVAPDGRVFLAGMEGTSHYLDTSGTGAYTVGPATIFGNRIYGTAVSYDAGKILIAGGGNNDNGAAPTNTAEVIDLNAPAPAWRNVGPMAFSRRYLNGTLMADGKVLISGGTASAPNDDCTLAVLPAEIWDPATEKFTTVASMPHYRLYHSSAGLLPDGRVLSAGTTKAAGSCGGISFEDADFYSPPYLFAGTRPVIASAPATIGYGQHFSVTTSDAANIAQVNLISFSAATHHFNFSQRINRLSFAAGTGTLSVTAPANANLCPPGKYMMFILNTAGAASVASVVSVIPAVTLTAPAAGATVSGTVSIAANVSSSVSWINIYIDGGYLASGPPFTFSWNSTKVSNGTHTISTKAYATGGTMIGSDSITVKVSNGATPTPSSSGSGTPTPIPSVTRTSTPVSSITRTPTPIPSVTRTSTPIPSVTRTSTPVPTMTRTSTPISTVTRTSTPIRTVTPTATATPAVVKLTAPANGATVSATVTIVAQVSRPLVDWINVYIDGHYLASGPPFTFSWNSTTVANGVHTISTKAFATGGAQIGSDALSVTVAN